MSPAHGTYARYQVAGGACRCDDCKKACRIYTARWRATPAGRRSKKIRSLASGLAVKWVIAEQPELWGQILDEATAQIDTA